MIDKLSKPVCYMQKRDMQELCGVSKATIFRLLKNLEGKGLIQKEEDGYSVTTYWRDSVNIYESQNETRDEAASLKMRHDESQNETHESQNETPLYIYNSYNNNMRADTRSPEEKLKRFPDWMGKLPLHRLVYLYSLLWQEQYGFKPDVTNWGMLGRNFKPLLKKYNEYQIAAFIILHFDWKGANNDSEFEKKMLEEKGYPLDLIPKRASIYKAYIMNYLSVKFDDEAEVKKWVSKFIVPLIKHDQDNSKNSINTGDGGSGLQTSRPSESGKVPANADGK